MTFPNTDRAIYRLEQQHKSYCNIVTSLKESPSSDWNLSEIEQRRDDAATLLELAKEGLAARNRPEWVRGR